MLATVPATAYSKLGMKVIFPRNPDKLFVVLQTPQWLSENIPNIFPPSFHPWKINEKIKYLINVVV